MTRVWYFEVDEQNRRGEFFNLVTPANQGFTLNLCKAYLTIMTVLTSLAYTIDILV